MDDDVRRPRWTMRAAVVPLGAGTLVGFATHDEPATSSGTIAAAPTEAPSPPALEHGPGTAMPGAVGNVVVAAHRTSHGGPFRHIDQLTPGDTVEFTTTDGEFTDVVTQTQVVDPAALWIVDPTDTTTATLFACDPPGSVRQRIVVNLELAS